MTRQGLCYRDSQTLRSGTMARWNRTLRHRMRVMHQDSRVFGGRTMHGQMHRQQRDVM